MRGAVRCGADLVADEILRGLRFSCSILLALAERRKTSEAMKGNVESENRHVDMCAAARNCARVRPDVSPASEVCCLAFEALVVCE